jgi:hypothetical protein
VWCMEAPVLTVGKDSGGVERRLAAGGLVCPGLRGLAAAMGAARVRVIHGEGQEASSGLRQTDTWLSLSDVKGAPFQSATRCSSAKPASRAMRSHSAGQM